MNHKVETKSSKKRGRIKRKEIKEKLRQILMKSKQRERAKEAKKVKDLLMRKKS